MIPVDDSVLEAINQAREKGQKVYLATAADRRFAEVIANSIGKFDGVFASESGTNLKGQRKADCLIAAFGIHGFDYIGNDAADIPAWRAARTAFISGASSRLVQQLRAEFPGLLTLTLRRRTIGAYLRALRPHQWLKNTLVALPAIAAHDFSISGVSMVLITFISFSLAASSVYLVNDMLDVPHDRSHPEKRNRPLAAGLVPISHAVGLLGLAVTLSVTLGLLLPWTFMLALIAYFGLSMSYSLYLKRKLMIDVVALAALYGSRVLAGGAATGIVLSHWLVGFCFFIFLSLALVKRTAEMITLPANSVGNIKGRGYRREDLQTIPALTAASGFVAVLVLALYINSPDVRALYRNPELLWGACVILIYWLGRVYFLTGRGEMHQDPVIFAATDWVSLMAGSLIVVVFLAAL
jgi:4-hydroxybenzoate polyprenyltransferase